MGGRSLVREASERFRGGLPVGRHFEVTLVMTGSGSILAFTPLQEPLRHCDTAFGVRQTHAVNYCRCLSGLF
jgi:hypothetical protein